MNKKIATYIITAGVLLTGAGCKKFLDVNTDPAGAQRANNNLLLTGVEVRTAFTITGGYPARTAMFWTQQLAYNQPAPEWDTYKSTASDVENTWAFDMYPGNLMNLKLLEAQAHTEGNNHFEGIAKVMLAYELAVTTDLWNDIPYSEGFKGFGNLTPKYDSQENIYKTIGTLLDSSIILMTNPDKSISQPDAKDLIYGTTTNDQMDSWIKFANLLKARYALRLVYAPGHTVAAQAAAALAAVANSFPDATYNAGLTFGTAAGNEAPWYQFVNTWGSVMMSSTMIDRMKASNDPRLPVFATKNNAGQYVGRVIGAEQDAAANISTVGDLWTSDGTGKAQTVYFGTYDELLFIKAEATFLTTGFATAQPILIDAVKASMKRFGLSPDSADVKNYITAHCTLTAANAYETIMTEKYLSNFLSLEAFNDWRRTNLPKLTVVQNAYQGITTIPRRFLYPASENETNKQPQQPGKLTDRVWWDTK